MKHFELSAGLRIGHKEIDAEHEQLIALLNGCRDVAESGEPSTALFIKVVQLRERLIEHIAREEQIMQDLGFGGIERERQEHKRAMEDFCRLTEACRTAADIHSVIQDLSACLLSVFIKSDMGFKGYLHHIDYRDEADPSP